MTSLLLSGLSDRDAAAVEILVKMQIEGISCIQQKRSALTSAIKQNPKEQACHFCLVDLGGIGLRRFSEANHKLLNEYLNGRPAVLLVAPDSTEWMQVNKDNNLIWLQKPYPSSDLSDALKTLSQSADQSVDQDKPASRWRDSGLSGRSRNHKDELTIRSGALQELKAAVPVLGKIDFIKLVEDIIADPSPKEIMLNVTSFWVDHRKGQIKSNIPLSATIVKFLDTPGWLDAVKVKAVAQNEFDEYLNNEKGSSRDRIQKTLDVITWELGCSAISSAKLELKRDIVIKLKQFPNFTQITKTEPIDIQLAAICVRSPQSVNELLRAFPKLESGVLRFVVLSLISGLAVIVPKQQAKLGGHKTKTDNVERRGFFKQLLARLR